MFLQDAVSNLKRTDKWFLPPHPLLNPSTIPSVGPLTLLSHKSSNAGYSRDSCGTLRHAKTRAGKYLPQGLCRSTYILVNIFFRVPSKLSNNPLRMGDMA